MLTNTAPPEGIDINDGALAALLDHHRSMRAPSMRRLWAYYRNPLVRSVAGPAHCPAPNGAAHLAQASGLPQRLRGGRLATDDDRRATPDVVIENDIAWRIDALVDFAVGSGVAIRSAAPDEGRRAEIQQVLDAAWEASGGVALLQDMALLASVHGFIDLVLRWEDLFATTRRVGGGDGASGALSRAVAGARRLRIDLIEATNVVPILDPTDGRTLHAHAALWKVAGAPDEPTTIARRSLVNVLGGRLRNLNQAGAIDDNEVLEVRTASRTQRYEKRQLVADIDNPLGVIPIAHVQNASQPDAYEGLSDVEPLIPLQDELNTRLSDRAHRVTLQSFKMYLARGVDGFADAPVGPGQVWATDNPDASIDAFGGDAHSPSEDRHISELRDAMDKTSGVSPVVLGIVREKLGHLSSENALRITFLGVLSKTARKRLAYGRAIGRMSELILHALDVAGVYRTTPAERRVTLDWPDPLPVDESERLRAARLKLELGVARERVLKDLNL